MARTVIPQCRFDEAGCADGILALRSYRRKWNEETKQYSKQPLHDWASNFADAFRYFATVAKLSQHEGYGKLKADIRSMHYGFSLEELYAAQSKIQIRRIH